MTASLTISLAALPWVVASVVVLRRQRWRFAGRPDPGRLHRAQRHRRRRVGPALPDDPDPADRGGAGKLYAKAVGRRLTYGGSEAENVAALLRAGLRVGPKFAAGISRERLMAGR